MYGLIGEFHFAKVFAHLASLEIHIHGKLWKILERGLGKPRQVEAGLGKSRQV